MIEINANTNTFHVVNLGCKVNRVESDSFAAALLQHGLKLAPVADADVVIINTCTVTGEAEKKTRKAVRHVLRENDHACVVVTGCAVAIDQQTYEDMSARVSIVAKGAMLAELENIRSSQEVPTFNDASDALRVGDAFPTRVGVKVQDGCNNACTYCIVHVARGRATSRPHGEILHEVRALASSGVHEIVLTGINLGSYDYEGQTLAALLKDLLAATPQDVRFRISSVEPKDVDDDLIEIMTRANGRICRHLHLPLQAGSAKVLKEMARPYKAWQYRELVDKLYAAMPMLSLSTDIIVGFPGETDQDFQDTLEMAQACRFSKIHIFRYSMRAGTPAAKRPDQVPPEVKAQRAKQLEALERQLHEQDILARKNTRELVLVETDGKATTESYHEVPAPAGYPVGSLVECQL